MVLTPGPRRWKFSLADVSVTAIRYRPAGSDATLAPAPASETAPPAATLRSGGRAAVGGGGPTAKVPCSVLGARRTVAVRPVHERHRPRRLGRRFDRGELVHAAGAPVRWKLAIVSSRAPGSSTRLPGCETMFPFASVSVMRNPSGAFEVPIDATRTGVGLVCAPTAAGSASRRVVRRSVRGL